MDKLGLKIEIGEQVIATQLHTVVSRYPPRSTPRSD